MTQPQQDPKSTGAQKWTAVMATPVGIIGLLILLPLILCCGFCGLSGFVGQFR